MDREPDHPARWTIRYSPAWNVYQAEQLELLIENEELGVDNMPDLFYVNFKSTDLAGHEWNMLEEEVRQDLAAQDLALKQIVKVLNRQVGHGNYVLSLTADHGYPTSRVHRRMVDRSERTSERPRSEVRRGNSRCPNRDVESRLRVHAQQEELKRNGITVQDIVEWIQTYSIGDNAKNDDLGDFNNKADERIFLTVLTPRRLEAGPVLQRRVLSDSITGADQTLQHAQVAVEEVRRHERLEEGQPDGSEDAGWRLKGLSPEEVSRLPHRRDEDLALARHPAEVLDPGSFSTSERETRIRSHVVMPPIVMDASASTPTPSRRSETTTKSLTSSIQSSWCSQSSDESPDDLGWPGHRRRHIQHHRPSGPEHLE